MEDSQEIQQILETMGIIGITISMGSLKNKPPEKRTKEEEEERERSRRLFGTKDFTMVNRSADFIFDTAWKLTKFEERCDKCGESTGNEAYECSGCQEVLCPNCMSEGLSGKNYDEWANERVVEPHESGFHVGIPQTREQLADEHMGFASPLGGGYGNMCRDCLEDYDMQEKDAIEQANDDMRESNEEYRREHLETLDDSIKYGKNMSQEEKDALTQERIDRLAQRTVDEQIRMRYPDGPFGANFDPMKYASEDRFDAVWDMMAKMRQLQGDTRMINQLRGKQGTLQRYKDQSQNLRDELKQIDLNTQRQEYMDKLDEVNNLNRQKSDFIESLGRE